ncbi:RNA polymerase sigma-70 factor, ECF subfamily [Mucilaginibacter gossypiicola]|uniref:RNA polymerase sigma-70 factor, ECF subfamily n=1 Tax=Mucilaginibacter gossypiicola TaxID=551995 RepID=A0A1H8B476_9SPHI|nr:sigma-70 family RNA polymerase sigma factor [Mucilaginibacter gossypiicola]SEM76657.1 RNA polymerase sigma-70 factor, ECF subfamily [Mucilaginibacter gossypiicola]
MGHKRKLTFPEGHLIKLIRERHPEGAKALYHMYSGSLYGVISRIITDEVLSEDVLQECFIKVWHSFDSYDENRGRLYTWMSNIARNMAIDQLRSKDFRNSQQHQRISESYEEFYEDEVSSVNVDMRFLRIGANRLPDKERCIIDLIYYQGYTHCEAAEELQIPLGTIKTRIIRAIKRLRLHYALEYLPKAS